MFAIEEAKLPPPTPASIATASSVPNETPGSSTIPAATHGTSSSSALMIVQFRPPTRATASVYGIRSTAPTAAGRAVSRNFCEGSNPYAGPRKSTKTAQRLQTEKPMCSARIEKTRFRRATRSPRASQKAGSSGLQSSIQRVPRPRATAGAGVETLCVDTGSSCGDPAGLGTSLHGCLDRPSGGGPAGIEGRPAR